MKSSQKLLMAWLVSLVMLPIIGCKHEDTASTTQTEEAAVKEEKPEQTIVLPISATHPKMRKDAMTIKLEGHVISSRKRTVAAQSDGIVRQVRALVGDQIGVGQTLVVLDNPEQAIDLNALAQQHQINVQIATSLAKKTSDYRDMLKIGLVARHDLQAVENDLRTKLVEQKGIEQQMAHLRLRKFKGAVVSTQSGYLQDIISEGSFVTMGQTLATLVSPQDQYLEVFVPADKMNSLRSGSLANWTQGNATHSARVMRITPESQSGLIRVLLQADTLLPLDYRPELELKLQGMTGWILPKSAVALVDGEPVFYKIVAAKTQPVKAKIVRDMDGQILVSNPLTPADLIATSQVEMLHEDMKVRVTP